MKYTSFRINKKRYLYRRYSSYKKYSRNPILIFSLIVPILLISYLSLKSLSFKPNYYYYISEKGSDNNDGSIAHPLRSLQGFKSLLIKDINDNKITEGSIKVYLDKGTYSFSESFKLSSEDLSYKDISISFIGKNKDKVYITGGITLDNNKLKAIDNNILSLFKDKIYSYDLSEENIDFNLKNNSIDIAPEVFLDNEALSIARYPNDDFLLTDIINNNEDLEGNETYSFNIKDQLPSNFNYDNAYLNVYWKFDWSDSTAKIENLKDNTFTIKGTLPYGIKENQRFYLFNIFEALDTKNEYYIDYDKNNYI